MTAAAASREEKGWIKRDLDPRGWFHWCARMLGTWKMYTGNAMELQHSRLQAWQVAKPGWYAHAAAAAPTFTHT